jgi:hypothetical protein
VARDLRFACTGELLTSCYAIWKPKLLTGVCRLLKKIQSSSYGRGDPPKAIAIGTKVSYAYL